MGLWEMAQLASIRTQLLFREEDFAPSGKAQHARGTAASKAELRAAAAAKLLQSGNLTREEVAAHLDVSTRQVQRMDKAGTLPRCPNMGTVVRYGARDVLRLASAR